ncbi:pilus assembly protein PilP [Catenovulum maritimum]|uniref:Pilus assembly protein PilP n=1 Tax=Catenovulum maritimum TaxID=1513271 RepID=A0A0J8GT36_9ALTE|nr:pilus assembly protein PilP [Catenovulum maritimum]KMT65950.1 pilus assembly protein PilP [Catenovulum maritimum]
MKTLIYILMLCLFITGCGKDISDLQVFTDQVKATTQPNIEDMPTIEEFASFEYSVSGLRSPFIEPEPELLQEQAVENLNCLQPDYARTKHPLEQYPLDSIKMQGTLGNESNLYALAVANDGRLFRVKAGDFLGLFHGKIERITTDAIYIKEMVPDGTGCWAYRKAELTILATDPRSGNN